MRNTSLTAASFIFFLSTTNAFAYLDPGTGSILLQGIIGTVAGGLFMMKLYWAKFKDMIQAGPSTATSDDLQNDVNDANNS